MLRIDGNRTVAHNKDILVAVDELLADDDVAVSIFCLVLRIDSADDTAVDIVEDAALCVMQLAEFDLFFAVSSGSFDRIEFQSLSGVEDQISFFVKTEFTVFQCETVVTVEIRGFLYMTTFPFLSIIFPLLSVRILRMLG